MRRLAIKIAAGGIAAVFAANLLLLLTVGTRAIQTCTFCRAERTDRTLLGYSWQRYRDTEFTSWYRSHRPAHEHQWGRLTCTLGLTIFGSTTYFGCGDRHPVCNIPPEQLRVFAERADPSTLTAFFDGIASTDREQQELAVQMAWGGILRDQ